MIKYADGQQFSELRNSYEALLLSPHHVSVFNKHNKAGGVTVHFKKFHFLPVCAFLQQSLAEPLVAVR